MTVWIIEIGGITYTNIFNCEAYFSENSLDYFDFSSKQDFALDSEVKVYFHGELILEGYITDKHEEDGYFKYRVYERAIELAGLLVDYNGKFRDTWVNLDVNTIIERIIANSDWKRDIDSDDTTVIPSITYEYTTKLDALFKLFKDIRGAYVWFGSAYTLIDEQLAEGVNYYSTDTPITLNLSNTPVRAGKVELYISYFEPYLGIRRWTYTPPDDGNGNISYSSPYTGDTVFSGTVDYDTGTITITYINSSYDPVEFISARYVGLYPKCVRYASVRGTKTIDDARVVKVTKKDIGAKASPSKIIVLGAGDGINQVYAERGSGTPVKVFVYKDLKTQEEVDAVADKLYDELVVNKPQEVTAIIKAPYQPFGDYFYPGYQLSSTKIGSGYVKETKVTNVIELNLGKQKTSVGKAIKNKLRGIEPQSYFAQGVTNVANFGGWETAVDSTHPAIYNFFLPDSSVGTIKVNECYINVYGRPYRIWSKAVGTASLSVSDTYVESAGIDVALSSGTWSQIATYNVTNDTLFILVTILGGKYTKTNTNAVYSAFNVRISDGLNYYPDSNGVVCEFLNATSGHGHYFSASHAHTFSWSGSHNHYVQIDGTSDVTGMDVVYLSSDSNLYYSAYDLSGLYSVETTSKTITVSGTTDSETVSGYTDAQNDVWSQMVSKTILIPGNLNGKTLSIEVYPFDDGSYWFWYEIYAFGTHTHEIDSVAGIMEVNTYPSNVEIIVNGTSVTTITGNASTSWSQEKIDITNYVQPGKNTIEVRSSTLGNICVEGFYRIFIETSK